MNSNNEQSNDNEVRSTQETTQGSVFLTPGQQGSVATNLPFAQATAIASQLSQQPTGNRASRWDVRTPTDKQSGGGSGNNGNDGNASSINTGEV